MFELGIENYELRMGRVKSVSKSLVVGKAGTKRKESARRAVKTKGVSKKDLAARTLEGLVSERIQRDDMEGLRVLTRGFEASMAHWLYRKLVDCGSVKCIEGLIGARTATGWGARAVLPSLACMYGGSKEVRAACRGSGCEVDKLLDIINGRDDVSEDERLSMRLATVGMS